MKNKIIVTVRGGNVESIHSTDPNIEVVMLDYDNFEAGDEPDEEQQKYMEILDSENSESLIESMGLTKIY